MFFKKRKVENREKISLIINELKQSLQEKWIPIAKATFSITNYKKNDSLLDLELVVLYVISAKNGNNYTIHYGPREAFVRHPHLLASVSLWESVGVIPKHAELICTDQSFNMVEFKKEAVFDGEYYEKLQLHERS